MLAALDRPDELERSSLALQLRDTLGCASTREAILQIVEDTFDDNHPQRRVLRDVILMPALRGDKRIFSAAVLNMSARTFFRRRAAAVAMLAHTIERVLNAGDPRADFKAETAQLIGAVKPNAVKGLLEREAQRMGGKAALAALVLSLRNGGAVPAELVEQCTGHWRLLADLEIARHRMAEDQPAAYESARAAIHAAFAQMKGPSRDVIEFELAYLDRLDAVRRCDVDAAGRATALLRRYTGSDFHLRALAAICSAEQAADEGDLDKAEAMVADVQALTVRLNDFRIAGRTSHAASIVSLLRGDHAEASDLSHLTVAALAHIEPEFALCATAIDGRAQLLLGGEWERPENACGRFPGSYVTAFVECVYARHLCTSDATMAAEIVDRASSLAAARGARGVLIYAEATRAIVLEAQGKHAEAQAQRVAVWEAGMPLRRPFYLHDLLVHPAQHARAFGAFDLDDAFIGAMGRRCQDVLEGLDVSGAHGHLLGDAMIECVAAAYEAAGRELRQRLRARHNEQAAVALRHVARPERAKYERAFRRMAVELSYCLPVAARLSFVGRFIAAATDLLDPGSPHRAIS